MGISGGPPLRPPVSPAAPDSLVGSNDTPWLHDSWGVAFLAFCSAFGDDVPIKVNLPPSPIGH
jgi:hypothetical protein